MYEVFGEFDSYEELNLAAAGQKAEGDVESVLKLARENGIDVDDALDYVEGIVEEFSNPLMAAIGKLEIEAQNVDLFGIMLDWMEYIKSRCIEDECVAIAVRKKGKSLKGCLAELLKYSYQNCKNINADICKAAGVPSNCKLGMPDMGTAKKMITEYYLKQED